MDTHLVQTRNEAGELTYHVSVISALRMAQIDKTIWKISWSNAPSGERIRLVKKGEDWVYEPMVFDIPDKENIPSKRETKL